MATIDNINIYLNNLESAKTDLVAAITEKGVTVPSGTKYSGFAPLIDQITVSSKGKTWTRAVAGETYHAAYSTVISKWFAFPDTSYTMLSADGVSWITNNSYSMSVDPDEDPTLCEAKMGKYPIWRSFRLSTSGNNLRGYRGDVEGYTWGNREVSDKTWATAIDSALANNSPVFCTGVGVKHGAMGEVIPGPGGLQMEITSSEGGSNFKSAWQQVWDAGYQYAWNPIGMTLFTTDSNFAILYEVTEIEGDFSAYPECGADVYNLDADPNFYIRKCTAYLGNGLYVRAHSDVATGYSGLQYTTDFYEDTWINSNIWGTPSTAGTFGAVLYADGLWVAGGTKGLYYSTDGKSWTEATINNGYSITDVYSLYYYNGVWVSATENGIFYSK